MKQWTGNLPGAISPDRSLMDAAAAMRYSRTNASLYELHACLDDDGHLNAARQLIAGAGADAQH